VLFTSDHGEMLGDHYYFRKVVPFEGSARVPFLLTGPGIPAGTVIDEPVSLADVMPTLLDCAGIAEPDTVDGRSVLPLITAGSASSWREYVHIEHAPCYHRDEGYHCLTDGRMKYIWWTSTGREQLFHLAADPNELQDLAADPQYAATLAVWRERMIAQLQGRPEGFTDGTHLLPGREYPPTLPWVTGRNGG
jgi:arylsulfatase